MPEKEAAAKGREGGENGEKGRTSLVRSGRSKHLRRSMQMFAATAANIRSVRCEPIFIL